MTTFRSEELFVGVIGLVLLPLIARRVLRGFREGRLPVYRTYLSREENAGKFNLLLALHTFSFLVVAVITADLLLDLNLRDGS